MPIDENRISVGVHRDETGGALGALVCLVHRLQALSLHADIVRRMHLRYPPQRLESSYPGCKPVHGRPSGRQRCAYASPSALSPFCSLLPLASAERCPQLIDATARLKTSDGSIQPSLSPVVRRAPSLALTEHIKTCMLVERGKGASVARIVSRGRQGLPGGCATKRRLPVATTARGA